MREKLIEARKNSNLTQMQVANAVCISYRQYQNIEAGTCKPNIETAISIAKLLHGNAHDLFDTTQANCNTPPPGGIAEAQELEKAQSGLVLDVKLIADIIDNGRIDCPERREKAQRLHDAIGAALG